MGKKRTLAQKECANWIRGKCLGCMLYYDNGSLTFRLRKKMVGKKCFADDGTCEYFEKIVMRGIK